MNNIYFNIATYVIKKYNRKKKHPSGKWAHFECRIEEIVARVIVMNRWGERPVLSEEAGLTSSRSSSS